MGVSLPSEPNDRRRLFVTARKVTASAIAAIAAAGLAACGSSSSDTSTAANTGGVNAPSGTINGAGSTLAAPVYQQWGSNLKGKGISLNYAAVGSGGGVAQWTAGTADFGASDPSLQPADKSAAKKKGDPVQIPTVLGAITVSYNVSGVDKGLKLDGKTIADIFMGTVKSWNSPEIKALNPGANLPSTAIQVVHRSDESGTTKGFTTFLSAYSPEWKSKIGADKTVKWPTGTGAKGNSGVAAAVKQSDGAIGYVEEAYALQNNFTYADVKNKSGKFVEPTLASTSAAADGITIPADLGYSAIDSPNASAYPIASQTFVDVFKDMCKAGLQKGTAQRIVAFLNYGLTGGQDVAKQLSYAPLPSALQSKAQAAVKTLECNGSPISG
jgi:phosphate transport system substrate-binding protein